MLTGEISENLIENNGGSGIEIQTSYGARSDLTIAGNTIHDNRDYGILLYSEYFGDADVSSIRVRGNTIYASGKGIFCSTYWTGMDVEISGNELYNGTTGVSCYTAGIRNQSLRATITRNNIHDNSDRGIHCYADWGDTNLYPEIIANHVHRNSGGGIRCARAELVLPAACNRTCDHIEYDP